jgi:CBS domain containing-hemolysin-like protein
VVAGGRTLGLVALEDVLEQLIGDVRDAAVEGREQSLAEAGARAGGWTGDGATAGAGAGGR